LIHYGWPNQSIQLLVSPNPSAGDPGYQWDGDQSAEFPEPWPPPFVAPTRLAILAALDWLRNNSGDQTTVLIYFSGHGSQMNDTDGDEAALDKLDETISPMDTGVGGVTDITDDEFVAHIAGIRGNVTVILDSCHSGGFAGRNDALVFRPSPWDQPQDIAGHVSIVLASCCVEELSVEDRWGSLRSLPLPHVGLLLSWRDDPYDGHGLFTDWLLIGMNCIVAMTPGGLPIVAADCPQGFPQGFPGTGNGDGYVSAEELFHFIRHPDDPADSFSDFFAEALHTQYGENQHPELWDSDNATDVILIDIELAYA